MKRALEIDVRNFPWFGECQQFCASRGINDAASVATVASLIFKNVGEALIIMSDNGITDPQAFLEAIIQSAAVPERPAASTDSFSVPGAVGHT